MCFYYEAPLSTSRIRGEAQLILAPVPVVSPIAYRSTDYTSGDALTEVSLRKTCISEGRSRSTKRRGFSIGIFMTYLKGRGFS